ncbi:catalytic protein kinase [Ordospora colligata OC4]|uniref:Catalytic protein kinase n=1 Tax=Ordospora colligata OC4 TaxID=1354746 RepID=A0A0B2UMD0_9MICR|nr:catalytic protein kinase [Ordospora colligata OC4]KHN70202.1 catalytic protein kinase [Ordospora colligata OC4]
MRKYRLKGLIGEGVSSTVYKGVSDEGDEVAVKIVSKGRMGKWMSDREAGMLGMTKHENVIGLIDHFETENHVYLVEELCDMNLVGFLNEYEVDESVALKTLRMILCGVEHIHSQGIMHRDLKLGNILLKGNTAKICDFGLSCYLNESDGRVCGTSDYIAPEMASGSEYSLGVDMWSVGVIFYALLTRKKYMKGSLMPVCSSSVKDLLERLLEVDVRKRICSKEALMHECFGRFIPSFEDFRCLFDFEKETKHGMIRKSRGCVEMGDVKVTARMQYKDEYKHGMIECMCGQRFEYVVYVNGREVELIMVTNQKLKILSLMAAYIKIAMQRTAKIVINDDGVRFSYMFSGDFLYNENTKGVILKRVGIMYEMIDGLGKKYSCSEIPDDLREKVFELMQRCKKIDEEVCWFSRRQPILVDCLSKQQLSMSMPWAAEASEMNIRSESRYYYASGIGWCVRNGFSLVFLLIDGEMIEVECLDLAVRSGERMLKIGDGLPHQLKCGLKRILPLIMQMM